MWSRVRESTQSHKINNNKNTAVFLEWQFSCCWYGLGVYFLDTLGDTQQILFLASWNFQFSEIDKKALRRENKMCIFGVKSEPSLKSLVCGSWLQAPSPQAPSGLDHWLTEDHPSGRAGEAVLTVCYLILSTRENTATSNLREKAGSLRNEEPYPKSHSCWHLSESVPCQSLLILNH